MAGSKKQIHVEIEADTHKRLKDICTETGQISILIRKLIRAFLRHMNIEKAAESVAKNQKED